MRNLLLSFLFCSSLLTACTGGGSTSSTSGGGNDKTGDVIVGVTSDLRVGVDIDRVHVVMREDDQVVRDEILSSSSASEKLELPAEFGFMNLADGTPVAIDLEAFNPADPNTPLVKRSASTTAVAGTSLLLRAQLDSRCVVAPGSMAPVCDAPQTCVAGVCTDSFVNPSLLSPYSPTWSQTSDVCKPAGAGTPVVLVGQGQADYLPMNDLDMAQVEAGPQGGYHIWIAIRVKNLLQSGSITTVTGTVPELNDLPVGPYQVIFTFEPDEGGYCKLFGLRLQLDQNASIQDLLGKTVKVTVKVTDKDGDVGVGEKLVKLSSTIL